MQLIWADAGYHSQPLVDWLLLLAGWLLETVKRPKGNKGFVLLPKRWVVERTFAWLSRFRRLSKDYEQLPETSVAMIYAAMIHLMLKRLGRLPAHVTRPERYDWPQPRVPLFREPTVPTACSLCGVSR